MIKYVILELGVKALDERGKCLSKCLGADRSGFIYGSHSFLLFECITQRCGTIFKCMEYIYVSL